MPIFTLRRWCNPRMMLAGRTVIAIRNEENSQGGKQGTAKKALTICKIYMYRNGQSDHQSSKMTYLSKNMAFVLGQMISKVALLSASECSRVMLLSQRHQGPSVNRRTPANILSLQGFHLLNSTVHRIETTSDFKHHKVLKAQCV